MYNSTALKVHNGALPISEPGTSEFRLRYNLYFGFKFNNENVYWVASISN